MNCLQLEQHRLFGSLDSHDAASGTRVLMLELARPADWSAVVRLVQGVIEDLALPAPAISVSGVDGFQLWFSTQELVPISQALAFLQGVCTRYWPQVDPHRLRLQATNPAPSADTSAQAPTQVPMEMRPGQWSAYIAPDLGAVFADTPWLDAAPSPQAQADVLSTVQSSTGQAFAHALAQLQRLTPQPAQAASAAMPKASQAAQGATGNIGPVSGLGAGYTEPRQFLLDVMNDTSSPLRWRLEAAKTLLNRTS